MPSPGHLLPRELTEPFLSLGEQIAQRIKVRGWALVERQSGTDRWWVTYAPPWKMRIIEQGHDEPRDNEERVIRRAVAANFTNFIDYLESVSADPRPQPSRSDGDHPDPLAEAA